MDSPSDGLQLEDMAVSPAKPHDSMVTVRLSEPPVLKVDTNTTTKHHNSGHEQDADADATGGQSTPSIMLDGVEELDEVEVRADDESPRITMSDQNGDEIASPAGSESARSGDGESRRGSESTEASEDGEVNWEELEKTEEQEPRDEASDDVSQ